MELLAKLPPFPLLLQHVHEYYLAINQMLKQLLAQHALQLQSRGLSAISMSSSR
jgi:hypothetical protein